MSQTVGPRGADYPVDPDFDPLSPGYLADPYPYYERFRREAPIFYAPQIDFWVVSRYEDAARIVKDPQSFSNTPSPTGSGRRPRASPGSHSRWSLCSS